VQNIFKGRAEGIEIGARRYQKQNSRRGVSRGGCLLQLYAGRR